MLSLVNNKIEHLKGIGSQKSILLKKELGIVTIYDLVHYFPFRYEDRSNVCQIKDLKGVSVSVNIKGEVTKVGFVGSSFKKRMTATFKDETGEIQLVWFKGLAWIGKVIKPGAKLVVYGKPSIFNGTLNIVHPEIEPGSNDKCTRRIVPVYSTTEYLTKRYLNSKGICKLVRIGIDQTKGSISECLPSYLLKSLKLIDKETAINYIHFPTDIEEVEAARRRLKFEELFYLQLRLLKERKNKKEKRVGGFEFKETHILKSFYKNSLPYELTAAQKRVMKEIFSDLSNGYQMNRLVQGDVGSGKTIVAFMSMLIALSNGYQVALMAPTEILAEQHFNNLKNFFEDLNINVDILTGSTKTKKREEIRIGLELGTLNVLFGTHALIEDKVKFKNLGLAVIDEQHRFGVMQRAKIWSKNDIVPPHILVMTATPIPRTLAMTLYGNLDISIIDEMPKGRKPIKTSWVRDSGRLKIFSFIKTQLAQGRQVYIVYPLIEESEKLDYKDLMDGYESISRAFPDVSIGVLHGQMRSEDKEYEMNRFVKGDSQIMVATTVIEVGINVPNATVMVIESAERFGLSQLHQLRGRVGRGADQSYCILVSGYKLSKESKRRLQIMVDTNDGFEIANEDLKLRGPGDLAGVRQSGLLNLKISDIIKDEKILILARKVAQEILDTDPDLKDPKNNLIKLYLEFLETKEVNLISIS